MELEITWNRTIRVWWAYFWRSIIVALCTMVLMFIFGVLVGLMSEMMGFEKETIITSIKIFGYIIGIVVSVYPMKLILGKDIGDFRLALISKERPTEILTDNV